MQMNIKRFATLIVMAVAAAAGAQSLKMSVTDTGGGTLRLAFSGTRYDSYALYVASAAVDGGADITAWANTNFIANIAAGTTTYTYSLPSEIVSEGKYYRFFLIRDTNYQQIEYVANDKKSGGAYIDTGVTPTTGITMCGEVEYNASTDSGNSWSHLCGCYVPRISGNSSAAYFEFCCCDSSSYMYWASETPKINDGNTANSGNNTLTARARYGFRNSAYEMNVWNVTNSETVITKQLLPSSVTSFSATLSINLFRCITSNGTQYEAQFPGKVYSFAIENGSGFVRDYVPVLRNSDGVAGLYDLVDGEFKPSANASYPFLHSTTPVSGDFSVQSATRRAVSKSLSLERGLVAYYTFDEVSPVNHAPSSSITLTTYTTNGTITSGVQDANCAQYGFRGYLDIGGGSASLDGSESLTFENGNDFTLVVWMRAEARQGSLGNDPVFVGNGDWKNTSNPGVLLSMDSNTEKPDGYVVCNYSDRDWSNGRVRSNTPAIALGEWAFYAISHTSDNKFRFYRSTSEGMLERICEEDAHSLRLVDSPARKFHLGQDGTGNYNHKFSGKLDEFALWTRGLQPSDIERIYANGRSVNGRPGKALGDLMSPAMTVEDLGGNRVRLNFTGDRVGNYDLYVASDDSDKGNNFFDWANGTDTDHDVAPGDSSYEYSLPSDITDNHRAYRFFLMKDENCQQIEYVENTGSAQDGAARAASINTGYTPNKNTIVETEVEYAAGNMGWGYLFGAYDTEKMSCYGVGRYGGNGRGNGKWWLDYLNVNNSTNSYDYMYSAEAITTGNRYWLSYCVTNFSWRDTTDGEAKTDMALRPGRAGFPDDGEVPLHIFSCYTNHNVQYYTSFTGKMYSFTIREEGSPLHDYVPVTNTTQNKVGFYDFVGRTFYPSESATEFVGGPLVAAGRMTIVSDAMKAPGTDDPAGARWIGGAAGALDAASSWVCTNSTGGAVTGVPQSFTQITIANASELFSVAEGTLFAYRDIAVSGTVALSGDLDWSGIDLAKVSGGTLDLAGHRLGVLAKGNVASALTVTDTAADGELQVYVPEGTVVTNATLALSGAATLVKEGAGTLVTIATGQSNSGGTRVDCGTLATTNYVNSWVLGASGSKVEIGLGAMLRVENGYHGLENHNLVLAGGTLYMRNSLLIEGRSFIGSLTQTNNNSTIMVESTGGTDSQRDTEIASGSVWELGNHKLTVRFVPGNTDLWMPNGLAVKNGVVDFPSVMPEDVENPGKAVGGWLQMDGPFNAHTNVTVMYGMNVVRWKGEYHHAVSNFMNQISHKANAYDFSGKSRMDIYGTFTPYPDVKTNICGRLQMMDGSTIDLSGLANVTWSAILDGRQTNLCPMEYDETKRIAGVVPTIYIDLGDRNVAAETGLDRPRKIVSWDETPKVDGHPEAVGVRFVEKRGRYSLYQASSGIYVGCGFRTIFK